MKKNVNLSVSFEKMKAIERIKAVDKLLTTPLDEKIIRMYLGEEAAKGSKEVIKNL